MSKKTAALFLFAASVIWGASFAIMKSTLNTISANYLLAFRFTVGALGLSYVLFKNRSSFTAKNILRGAIVGLCLYGAFTIQTYGLMCIGAGKNALITALYVVIVPFFMWAFTKNRPSHRSLLAALVCFIGVAVLSLGSGTSNAIGETVNLFGLTLSGHTLELVGVVLTAVSGVFYALHIAVVSVFSQECDVMPLTFMQFLFAGIIAWTVALCCESFPTQFTPATWWNLVYLCVLSSMVALTFQNIGVKYAPPEYASLILCAESLFGCVFGVIILKETLSFSIVLGGMFVIASLLISELRIKRKRL